MSGANLQTLLDGHALVFGVVAFVAMLTSCGAWSRRNERIAARVAVASGAASALFVLASLWVWAWTA